MATLIDIRGLNRSEASGSGGTVGRGFRVSGAKPASLTTNLAGANNDLTYTAKSAGTGGDAITVTYAVAGLNTPLSVAVAGDAITVNVATDGAGAATSTASQVLVAVQASGPASALVAVQLAPGNDGSGIVAAMAPTNLSGGGATGNVMVSNLFNVEVDVDLASVRKTLSRFNDEFVTVTSGTNLMYIRSLDASNDANSNIARGFRIKDAAGTPTRVLAGGAAVQVNLDDPAVRQALREHHGRWIEANNTNSLVTIRGLSTSGATGYSIARGFRIKNQSGTQQVVNGVTNVQVNVSDAYVRRILRRNVNRYVVVSSP